MDLKRFKAENNNIFDDENLEAELYKYYDPTMIFIGTKLKVAQHEWEENIYGYDNLSAKHLSSSILNFNGDIVLTLKNKLFIKIEINPECPDEQHFLYVLDPTISCYALIDILDCSYKVAANSKFLFVGDNKGVIKIYNLHNYFCVGIWDTKCELLIAMHVNNNTLYLDTWTKILVYNIGPQLQLVPRHRIYNNSSDIWYKNHGDSMIVHESKFFHHIEHEFWVYDLQTRRYLRSFHDIESYFVDTQYRLLFLGGSDGQVTTLDLDSLATLLMVPVNNVEISSIHLNHNKLLISSGSQVYVYERLWRLGFRPLHIINVAGNVVKVVITSN